MVVRRTRTKTAAKALATRMRRKGFSASVFNPKGPGFAVSITRKKRR